MGLGGVDQLYEYQKYGVRWMLERECDTKSPGGLLCDDVGLGKSIQILTVMKLSPMPRTLLLVPKATVRQWVGYIERWLPTSYCCHAYGPKFKKTLLTALNISNTGLPVVVICTYAMVNKNSASRLYTTFWDRMILDEVHNIRNAITATSRAVKNIPSTIRWGLSATPLQNNITDMLNILDWLRVSADEWDPRYMSVHDMRYVLAMKTRYMLSRQVAEVQKQLPHWLADPYVVTVECPMTPIESEAYRHLASEVREEAYKMRTLNNNSVKGATYMRMRVLMLRLMQFVASPALAFSSSDEMQKWAREDPLMGRVSRIRVGSKTRLMVDAIRANPCQRSLVFCWFREEMNIVQDLLSEMGMSSQTLQGDTTPRERESIERSAWIHWGVMGAVLNAVADAYPDCPRLPEELKLYIWRFTVPQVLIVQIQAGGTGLNMTGFNMVYFHSICWNPCSEHQAIGRSNRLGQMNNVRVMRMASVLCDQSEKEADQAGRSLRSVRKRKRWAMEVSERPMRMERKSKKDRSWGENDEDETEGPDDYRSKMEGGEDDRKEDVKHDTIDQRILNVQRGKRKLIKDLGTALPIAGQRKLALNLADFAHLLEH